MMRLLMLLTVFVPLIGMGQKKEYETLKKEYAATVKTFETTLQTSDSIEQLYQPKAKLVKEISLKLLEKRSTLALRKQQVLNVYQIMENPGKSSELPFAREAVYEVGIPDVRTITYPIVEIEDNPNQTVTR